MLTRLIPSTGEILPVIGLGTWQTFDTSHNVARADLTEVVNIMANSGGKLIDSSPMYGRAEESVGIITAEIANPDALFYATKVWTNGRESGVRQTEDSMMKMRRKRMDLIQVHNLVDLRTHLVTLRKWKDEGKIRYIGITHYLDSSHAELERILRSERPDFVQFNYSIISRNAEVRLLKTAGELGVATIINRPLGEGKLFAKVAGKPLPEFVVELGISSWAEFFLKYILAHPAVTCVIPATGNPLHAREIMLAGEGLLPDENVRKRMISCIGNG